MSYASLRICPDGLLRKVDPFRPIQRISEGARSLGPFAKKGLPNRRGPLSMTEAGSCLLQKAKTQQKYPARLSL